MLGLPTGHGNLQGTLTRTRTRTRARTRPLTQTLTLTLTLSLALALTLTLTLTQDQLARLQTENAALRSRVADVGVAEKTGLAQPGRPA